MTAWTAPGGARHTTATPLHSIGDAIAYLGARFTVSDEDFHRHRCGEYPCDTSCSVADAGRRTSAAADAHYGGDARRLGARGALGGTTWRPRGARLSVLGEDWCAAGTRLPMAGCIRYRGAIDRRMAGQFEAPGERQTDFCSMASIYIDGKFRFFARGEFSHGRAGGAFVHRCNWSRRSAGPDNGSRPGNSVTAHDS